MTEAPDGIDIIVAPEPGPRRQFGVEVFFLLVSRPANNFTIPAFHFETLSERNK